MLKLSSICITFILMIVLSSESLADECDPVLKLGVVETSSQDNDIQFIQSFRSWIKQAEDNGVCKQGTFDYNKYLQSDLRGSASICDAANKSFETSTSIDSSLRIKSKTRIRSINNAAYFGLE